MDPLAAQGYLGKGNKKNRKDSEGSIVVLGFGSSSSITISRGLRPHLSGTQAVAGTRRISGLGRICRVTPYMGWAYFPTFLIMAPDNRVQNVALLF
jgi:hypothetical protein